MGKSETLRRLRSEKSTCESRKNVLNSNISRLEEAKKTVGDVEHNVDGLKKEVQKKHDQSKTWTGTEYTWYDNAVDITIVDLYKCYNNGVGAAKDKIKDEIRRLKSELSSVSGTIIWLNIQIAAVSLWSS